MDLIDLTGSNDTETDFISSNYNLVQNNGDGNCLFYALSTAIGLIDPKNKINHDVLRSALCVWALNNKDFVFSFGYSLLSLVTCNIDQDEDKDTYYTNYWMKFMGDKVYSENLMLFVAAGYFNVDIFSWESFNKKKMILKEAFVIFGGDDVVRPQIHIFCSGNLSLDSLSGHFRLIDKYEYRVGKSRVDFTMNLRELIFDSRLRKQFFTGLISSKPFTGDSVPLGSGDNMSSLPHSIPSNSQGVGQSIADNVTKVPRNRKPKQIFSPSGNNSSIICTSEELSNSSQGLNIKDSSKAKNKEHFPTFNLSQIDVTPSFNHRWKEVTGLPPSSIEDFQRIFLEILTEINLSIEGKSSINMIRNNNCIIALLFFPSVCFYSNGKQKNPSTLKMTLGNILKSDDIIDNILSLREDYIKELSINENKKMRRIPQRKLDINAALPTKIDSAIKDFVKAGRSGKAAEKLFQVYENSCSDMFDTTGEVDPKFIQKFNELHPTGCPLISPQTDYPPIAITPIFLAEVISKLPSKSSTGLSSWSNELLRFVCSHNFDKKSCLTNSILSQLCCLINNIFKGQGGFAKTWIVSFFFFIDKTEGGYRPIAVDNIFVRLFGKCISKLRSVEIGDKLKSLQLGVGISGGCEFIAHTVSNWGTEIIQNPFSDNVIIKIDISNAFNSISREAIKDGIMRYCPYLLSYFLWAYGDATDLVLINGKVIGQSSSGVRQGDPLGPIFFSLGFHGPLLDTKEAFPDVDLMAYLDDGVFHSNITRAIEALKFFTTALKKVNLKINLKKTVIFGNSHIVDNFFDPDLPDICHSSHGFVVLGCPIGSSDFVKNELEKLYIDFTKRLFLLRKVDVQTSFILLKFCVNTKWNYYGRVCCPWLIKNFASKIDSEIDNLISGLIGINSLPQVSGIIRNFPSSLGIPRFEDISKPSWVSSFLKAFNFAKNNFLKAWNWVVVSGDSLLLNHIQTINLFKEKFPSGVDCFSFNNNLIPDFSQKELTKSVFIHLSSQVCSLLSDKKAKLNYYKACLHSKPFWFLWPTFCGSSPSIIFNAESFKVSVKLNLLVNVYPNSLLDCHCPCPRVDENVKIGDSSNDLHCFDCSIVATNRISRHNIICNELSHLILKYIPSSSVESEFQIRYKNITDKKADLKVTLPNGDIFFVDVTICNSGAKSYQNMDISTLLREKEKIKIAQYNCVGFDENSRNFIPFVLDVSGTLGKRAIDFIQYLHHLDSNKSDSFHSVAMRNINVVLASGLAKTIFSFNEGMNLFIPDSC
jgi:hypothetical protein